MMIMKNIILPVIRKKMKTLAKDIVNAQPMFSPHNRTYWPHQATVWWDDIYDIERWCYANLKSKNWRNRRQYFAFKREEDYLLFVLRWM